MTVRLKQAQMIQEAGTAMGSGPGTMSVVGRMTFRKGVYYGKYI